MFSAMPSNNDDDEMTTTNWLVTTFMLLTSNPYRYATLEKRLTLHAATAIADHKV